MALVLNQYLAQCMFGGKWNPLAMIKLKLHGPTVLAQRENAALKLTADKPVLYDVYAGVLLSLPLMLARVESTDHT